MLMTESKRVVVGGGALLDVGIYPAMWMSMVLGTPSKVTAHARMAESGVDCHTFATFEYESGAMAHLECSFNACLANYFCWGQMISVRFA